MSEFPLSNVTIVKADSTDWCPRCDRTTVWKGEFCVTCGYEWGVSS